MVENTILHINFHEFVLKQREFKLNTNNAASSLGVAMMQSTCKMIMICIGFLSLLACQSNVDLVLYQAAYEEDSMEFQFGYKALEELNIIDAPDDADLQRWAVLHDGDTYRFYCFRGDFNALYQFALHPQSRAFEYGYNSIDKFAIGLTSVPDDASTSAFYMLHDGEQSKLYLPSQDSSSLLYEFIYDYGTERYKSTGQSLNIRGAPEDTDFQRMAMLHNGTQSRLYALRQGSDYDLFEFVYDASTNSYVYQSDAADITAVTGLPSDSDTSSFAMLHNGINYRFFYPKLLK